MPLIISAMSNNLFFMAGKISLPQFGAIKKAHRNGGLEYFAGSVCLFYAFLVAYSKLMTTLCTAAGQHLAAVGSLHTLAETMY